MMVRFSTIFGLLIALSALTTGCTRDNGDYSVHETHINSVIPTPEEVAVLQFLNAPETTFNVLDGAVGLNRQAASALIQQRNGSDGVYGSEDDHLYGSMYEVDRVHFVGPATLQRLKDYAMSVL